jgi:hypothetical protein
MGSGTPGRSSADPRYGHHLEVPGQSGADSSHGGSRSGSRVPSTSGISNGPPNHFAGADQGFRPSGAHLQPSGSRSHGGSSRGPASHQSSAASHASQSTIRPGHYAPHPGHVSNAPTSSRMAPSYRPSPLNPGSHAPGHLSSRAPTSGSPSCAPTSGFPSRAPTSGYPSHGPPSGHPSGRPTGALAHGTHDSRGGRAVMMAWKTAGHKELAPLQPGEKRKVVEIVETKIRHIEQERPF